MASEEHGCSDSLLCLHGGGLSGLLPRGHVNYCDGPFLGVLCGAKDLGHVSHCLHVVLDLMCLITCDDLAIVSCMPLFMCVSWHDGDI
eukprot:1294354-Amphidinium_carterae.1